MANDATKDPSPKFDITPEDVCLWRRKRMAFAILSVSTTTWVLVNFYGFNFITIASWTAIAVVSMVFLWGNLLRLLSKVEPELTGLEVTEEFVLATVRSCRMLLEEIVRWMFRVGAESDLLVFARTVLGLWVLSRIGILFDFHTCLFIGVVLGLTVPKLWETKGDVIKKQLGNLKERSKGAYGTAHQKITMMMNKLQHGTTEEKFKKTE